jgi:hypothetical protein
MMDIHALRYIFAIAGMLVIVGRVIRYLVKDL